MKYLLLLLSLITIHSTSHGQSKEEIVEEAFLMYNSEMASWYGTDILVANYPELMDHVGGYFSYSENGVHKCTFFDIKENPNRILQISFDDSFDPDKAEIDMDKVPLNSYEMDLYTIRQAAFQELSTDTLFKRYENTNFNLIPIINKKERKVYVLTGPKINGVVVLGNDYLMTFNNKNQLTGKKAIHNNIIPLEYDEESIGGTSMHSHLSTTGDLITSTDLCTLMLYGDFTGWEKHIVLSKENVSFWDFERKELFVMTRKAWDKIGKQLEKEKK